jgi:hypothetical protein
VEKNRDEAGIASVMVWRRDRLGFRSSAYSFGLIAAYS